jgi:hypothetical protein
VYVYISLSFSFFYGLSPFVILSIIYFFSIFQYHCVSSSHHHISYCFFFFTAKLTITALLNPICKRVRTYSPATLLSSMTSSSTITVVPIANVETNTANNKQYLCLFHVITAGLLDESMGSDEQEIIEMIHLIIDVDQKKVCVRLNFDRKSYIF